MKSMESIQSGKPSSKSIPQDYIPTQVSHTLEDLQNLQRCLSLIHRLQKVYGKTPEELWDLTQGYSYILKDHSMDLIIKTIMEYIKRCPDIPSPSDINNIIDPVKPEWKPDWAVYNRLKDNIKQDKFVTTEQRNYMYRCERHVLDKAMEF